MPIKKLPEITHFQYLILSQFNNYYQSINDLTALLKTYDNTAKTKPALYMALHRLEDLSYVKGKYVIVNKSKERHYRLTKLGQKQLIAVKNFYNNLIKVL